MTLEEKQELIKSATTEEELEARMAEIQEAEKAEQPEVTEEVAEEIKKDSGEITPEEERSLIADTQELETRSKNISNFKKLGGNEEMEKEERKFTIADKEYRSAWAKKLMGLSEDKFSEEEIRALGDAVTTTATTYVASTSEVQGINNGGLFIPTSVRMDLMNLIAEESPIFRDARKLQVSGNVDLPYLFASDDANWYTELTDTVNEGMEFKNMQLTGWELAKDIVITWKLEEMAVESFITFILEELKNKMGKAIINAVIYGDGSNKPTGVTNGLTPVTTSENDTIIDKVIKVYSSLSDEARVGAKVYVSNNVNVEIISYKDDVGNYPFLAGIPSVKGFTIEVDPYLQNEDILAGNMTNYIFNEVTPMRVDKETTVKGRKTLYGGYGIYDGKPRPNFFALGRTASSGV